ncbi:hypothetical protein T492DRAFT_983489 [Pavlovales sp. CCMP2436]|nr:hypothetical protein T492DRAFT_983489 [Pavlovales sp. CCMP2436]
MGGADSAGGLLRPRPRTVASAPQLHRSALLDIARAHADADGEEADGSTSLALAYGPADSAYLTDGMADDADGADERSAPRPARRLAAPTPTPARALVTPAGSRHGAVAATSPAQPVALQTKPYSRAELELLPPHALGAVQDFEVGAPGIGSVLWAGCTDLRLLLHELPRLVIFAPRAVEVYPDGCRKPAVGHELNKRAMVSLLSVLPLHKRTGQALTDERSCALFEEKLRRKLAASDTRAEHISWDKHSGKWTFSVDHF